MAIYECTGTVTNQGNGSLKCSTGWTTYTPAPPCPSTTSTPVEITGELITRPAADALFSAVLALAAIVFIFRSLARLLRSF